MPPADNRTTATGYSYNAVGNLTSAPGVNASKVYDYDAENRQVAYKYGTATEGTATEATYGYDGDGRRVKKVVGTGSATQTTVMVYDAAGQLVAEYGTQTSGGGGGTSYLKYEHKSGSGKNSLIFAIPSLWSTVSRSPDMATTRRAISLPHRA